MTFAWNDDESFEAVEYLGRFGSTEVIPDCNKPATYTHWFDDPDQHGSNEHYQVLDNLAVSYYASHEEGKGGVTVEEIAEVLPDDPPDSFADGWDIRNPLPSKASTLITYTHDLAGMPTHDDQGRPLNLVYNGCFDSANGWGEWSYGFPAGTRNTSFWAPRLGHEREGAWVLHGYSRVFQWLVGLEPDTEYGLSFYIYHPAEAGHTAKFRVYGRMVDGSTDPSYTYNLTAAQDENWEYVAVRARTDDEGRLYAGVQTLGVSSAYADWLAIDDLMVWAEPDQGDAPQEGDCGTASCDLLHEGPVDVEVSRRHLGLNSAGWPEPNPLLVTVTLKLGDEDLPVGWLGGYLHLRVENLYDGPTRVFAAPWYGKSPGRFQKPDKIYDEGGDYYEYDESGVYDYFWRLPPGPYLEQSTWKIWVQPSEVAKLQIKAEVVYAPDSPVTDPPNLWDRTCVLVPEANIHPVVFVHGILGSMPPGDHVWAERPPFDWRGQDQASGGRPAPLLDPFLHSYHAMIDNLEKMGYEWGKTLHVVTYDWRASNGDSGAYLARQLPGIVGAASGVPYVEHDGRTDIVVHSMGGLVTRAYVEGKTGEPYANDLNRAAFIASPHEGFAVTYNTWEGVTWVDYLDVEVPLTSDARMMPVLMDYVLWPAFVLERYRPSPSEIFSHCAPWVMLSYPYPLIPACTAEAIHAWTHTEGSRGVGSLRQMLPTGDLIAALGRYLLDVDDPTAELPYEANTWLMELNDDVWRLDWRLGDIFVAYGDERETVVNYTVRPQPEGYEGMWQYGKKIVDDKDNVGDNLIPVRSTDLGQVSGAESFVPLPYEYTGQDAGHKFIPFNEAGQRDVGGFLGGYRDGQLIAQIPFYTPYDSTFALGNLSRVLFLAGRLLPPYPESPQADSAGGHLLARPARQPDFAPGEARVGLSSQYLLTDPRGRRLGIDPASGQVINEIPGAYVMGRDGFGGLFFTLPEPPEGGYTLRASGVASYTEHYAFTLYDLYRDGGGGVKGRVLANFTDTLAAGQVITYSLFVPARGAVGQWHLDEMSATIAYDSSGYEHHGRLADGPAWAEGYLGGALRFDGLDDHVWISSSARLNVSGPLTLEAWVYPESTAGEQVLLSRWGDGPGQRVYELALDEGHLRGRLSGDGAGEIDLGASTLALSAGHWQHVALTYDGTKAYYYVDGIGQETPNAPPAGGVFSGTAPLLLGRSSDAGSAAAPFAGLLDEVQLSDAARDDLAAWRQSDWSGGPGQAEWRGGDPGRYAAASGIDATLAGEIRLAAAVVSDSTVYSATGVLTSSSFSVGWPLTWTQALWDVDEPPGTRVELALSGSDDGLNWSEWTVIKSATSGGQRRADLAGLPAARYLRYRVRLAADLRRGSSPALRELALRAQLSPRGAPPALYGVHDAGGQDSQFFRLELESGQVTAIGPLYADYDVEAMDVHPASGVLYAIAGGGGDQDGKLFVVDKLSGALTLIGDTGAHGRDEIVSAAFHPDGTLWAFQENVGLLTIDLNDATVTLVWDVNGSGVGDNWEGLAWDAEGSYLYGAQGRNLYRWDPATESAQRICGRRFLPGVTEALDVDAGGTLFGGRDNSAGGTLSVFQIDLAACSSTSNTYDVPYADVESIAFEVE